VRARNLAQDAGCAVGAIYNVFGDLTDLVLAVNARTFESLGVAVSDVLLDAPSDAVEQLVIMSQAYHHFAAEHHNLWRAMFDVGRPTTETAPDCYLREMGQLMAHFAAPLSVISPHLGEQDLELMAHALFSSVHGIVLLALDETASGAPTAEIDRMISLVLRQLSASAPNS
jgi:AcrR family transcriptional regulator